ncbi:MAG: methyltransferase [Anaerolineaceae bacterium]
MPEPKPAEILRAKVLGFVTSRCIHVVAELGVADALGEGPATAEALAHATGSDPDSLGRVLRLLAADGIFAEADGGFVHTELSRLLRSDHPQSLRPHALRVGTAVCWSVYGVLEHSVRTGEPAFEQVYPGGTWAYHADNPDAGALFNAGMTAKAHADTAAVLKADYFSGFQTIADIGGGRGHLVRAVLASVPGASGVLFDQPHVIAEAGDTANTPGLRLQGGDFFADALPRADAYLLMSVIHDWADAEAKAILSAVRKAAPANARVLLIEAVVPDSPGWHFSKLVDIVMLAETGGRERTGAQYEALLASAGLRLERIVPTQGTASIIEAVPVQVSAR